MVDQTANDAIAQLFDRLAGLLEMQEGGGFKARAYRRGAEAIRALPQPAAALVAQGADLQAHPGIGKAIDGKVRELIATGRVAAYERAAEGVTPAALALLDAPGVGGATARRLLAETGATTVGALQAALADGAGDWLPPSGPRCRTAIVAHLEHAGAATVTP